MREEDRGRGRRGGREEDRRREGGGEGEKRIGGEREEGRERRGRGRRGGREGRDRRGRGGREGRGRRGGREEGERGEGGGEGGKGFMYHVFICKALITVWLSSGWVTVLHIELQCVQKCTTHCTITQATHIIRTYVQCATQTLCGIFHLNESVGGGGMAVWERGNGDCGDDTPPLALLHLNPHILQQLVIEGVGHIKLHQ